jgi:hypothetical protein
MSHILSAFEAYRRKSFRSICLVPEFNWFSRRVLKAYTGIVHDQSHLPAPHELVHFAQLFDNYLSLFQFEENFASIVGNSLRTLIEGIKAAHRLQKQPASQKPQKQKKESEAAILPVECTYCFTIRRHSISSKGNRKVE